MKGLKIYWHMLHFTGSMDHGEHYGTGWAMILEKILVQKCKFLIFLLDDYFSGDVRRWGARKSIACEQALRGALLTGQEKKGELATTSLDFEYLHWKSRYKMLIGWDDSNDVITLGTCFSIYVYIRVLIGGYVTAQSTGSQRGIGGEIQIPET